MNNSNNSILLAWQDIIEGLAVIDNPNNIVYGVPKGGMIASAFLKLAKVTFDPDEATIILDDIIDSGATKNIYTKNYPQSEFYAIVDKSDPYHPYKDRWVVFPWEYTHPNGDDNVQENIVRQLQFIGEDPSREGILETPNRVVRSWQTLYSGYQKDPKDVFKIFDGDDYDEIVLLKDIEIYSMCEHHMLPFFGKAHIAYIANGKVIGISKLARLIEIFTRRLQIQERIGMQVTQALNQYLQPLGAACIIEAKHMCMCMRGVEKQQSIMITSSLTGRFRELPEARMELMNLIK